MPILCSNIHSQKILDEREASYLAGIIDGEGWIGVKKMKAHTRCGFKLQACMQISNSNLEFLLWLREKLQNGYICYTKEKRKNRKQVYRLSFSPNQVRHLLPQVLPYLFIKKPQAELILELLKYLKRGINRRFCFASNENEFNRMLQIRQQILSLNTRGNKIGNEGRVPEV